MKRSKRARKDPQNLRIVIVGGGLAGLSTALALEQAGFRQISVYERQPAEITHHGYGLTLTFDPQGISSKLGILEDLARRDCPSRSHLLLRHDGQILGYFGNDLGTEGKGWGQRGNLRVPRHVVRQVLTNKLQHSTIHYGYRLTDVRYDDDQVQVTLQRHGGKSVSESSTETTSVTADLLVGADGIRSTSLRLTLGDRMPPLRTLQIRLILGLSQGFTHTLLRERAFYTLAPGKRLFIMPYQGSPLECDNLQQVRYMWQLSFSEDQLDGNAQDPKQMSQHELKHQVLELTQDWHDPVRQLVESTPIASVWGTTLYDTSPKDTQATLLSLWKQLTPRYLPVGDALHAMSPFKGQGANHSLRDGTVLAQWLRRASLGAAVRNSLRELVQRTHPIVQTSRAAAQYWHSPLALTDRHRFAGLQLGIDEDKADEVNFAEELQKRGIHSGTRHVHAALLGAAAELGLLPQASSDSTMVDKNTSQLALEYARTGQLARLRHLSWKGAILAAVRDESGRTCLREAAYHGQTDTIHWLVTQAACDLRAIDEKDDSSHSCDSAVQEVLRVLRRRLQRLSETH